jgi:large subunit ribosomal protein L13
MTVKTFMMKKEDVRRDWYVVDASTLPLGRLAAQVAKILQGKNKPTYTPHVDTGDFVIVINARKVKLTGKKLEQKTYYHHTGFRGGLKAIPAAKLLEQKPERVIELAVRRMLPKTRLGRAMFKKLKVVAGNTHPHQAQKPKVLNL